MSKKPTTSRRPITRAKIAEIYALLRELDPEPKTELQYCNPFTLVVAVALSAQATDVGVNKATKKLFALADSPAKMLALGEDKVRELIKTIGLFRNKAKNVIGLSKLLLDEFDGEVPQNMDELIRLPGVGRKT
ncbi:Endonuclease III, partial [hydrothermal vent metagenome]